MSDRLPDELEELLDEWREQRERLGGHMDDSTGARVGIENAERDWRRRLHLMIRRALEFDRP